jgi:hypothetical protein
MSLTSTVPLRVPSVRHSSLPKADVLAVKKTRLLRATNLLGAELPKPDQISLTSDVPAAVPLVFQSSRPMWVLRLRLVCGAVELKKMSPPTAVISIGSEPMLPGVKSATSTVLAALPSLFHNSRPVDG